MRLIKHPVLCNYYVTYRCNATCHFCDIWEKPSPFIKLSEANQNLDALKRMGVKVVDFTGGEPLLHPQIAELLALAKQKQFITTLTTNGLRYPKFARQLKGLVDMLHFSLDASTAQAHNEIRGAACFEAIMESIPLALSLGERPDILFTVWNGNMSEIEAIWKNICLPNKLLLILNPIFGYNNIDSKEGLSLSALQDLKRWGRKKLVYVNDAFLKLREAGGNQIQKPVCKAGSSTVVIGPHNDLIVPCYHLGSKHYPLNNNLEEVYQSQEVQGLIAKEGRLEACQGCVINCYMQPSFAVNMNKYWFYALPSTFKYNFVKGTWRNLF
ncbi:MAG: radical SAM protein [Cytophagales bacterium]|nr:MAG: radical SAM protein [Cytophagales bacterium]TAF61321.1 MAG: radical SAM protein [Cytophagales bacterium]